MSSGTTSPVPSPAPTAGPAPTPSPAGAPLRATWPGTAALRRLGGAALVVGAAGCVVGGVLHPVVDGHAHSAAALTAPHEALGTSALLAGTVLLLLGLPAVYGWLAPRLGPLGLVGYLCYTLGNLLAAVPHLVVMATVAPEVARRAPTLVSTDDMIIDSPAFAAEQLVTGLTLVLGLALLGLALVRDPGLRRVGVLALIGAVVLVVPLPTVPVLGGVQVELARGVVAAWLGVRCAGSAGPRGRAT